MNFSNLFSIAGVDGSAGSKAPESIVSEMVSANGPVFLNELVRILGMRAEGGQTLSDHLRAEIDRASESEAHPDQDEEAPVSFTPPAKENPEAEVGARHLVLPPENEAEGVRAENVRTRPSEPGSEHRPAEGGRLPLTPIAEGRNGLPSVDQPRAERTIGAPVSPQRAPRPDVFPADTPDEDASLEEPAVRTDTFRSLSRSAELNGKNAMFGRPEPQPVPAQGATREQPDPAVEKVGRVRDESVRPRREEASLARPFQDFKVFEQGRFAVPVNLVSNSREARTTDQSQFRPSPQASSSARVEHDYGDDGVEFLSKSEAPADKRDSEFEFEEKQASVQPGPRGKGVETFRASESNVRPEPSSILFPGVAREPIRMEGSGRALTTERTETPLEARGVDRGELIQQIVQRVRLVRYDGSSTLEIRLKPAFLGRVQIETSLAADQSMSARFLVEDPQVRSFLESRIPALMEILGETGVRVQAVEVLAMNSESGQNGSDGPLQDQTRRNTNPSSQESKEKSSSSEDDEASDDEPESQLNTKHSGIHYIA